MSDAVSIRQILIAGQCKQHQAIATELISPGNILESHPVRIYQSADINISLKLARS
jgi:hypothetical protein